MNTWTLLARIVDVNWPDVEGQNGSKLATYIVEDVRNNRHEVEIWYRSDQDQIPDAAIGGPGWWCLTGYLRSREANDGGRYFTSLRVQGFTPIQIGNQGTGQNRAGGGAAAAKPAAEPASGGGARGGGARGGGQRRG